MNFINNQSRVLSEVNWEDPDSAFHEDLSAWGQIKHIKRGANSKSLELKRPTFRPKLMLPRPVKMKKNYREVLVSPLQMASRNYCDSQRVEGIIFKLIERSRITAEKLKKIGQRNLGDKLSTKVPFLHYKLNLPRSLNTLKTPKINKRTNRLTVTKPEENSFNYFLTGTSCGPKGETPASSFN
jgi:hypothetical protein